MSEITPGPWKAVEIDDGIFSIVGHPKWPCTRFGVKGEWDVAEIEQFENRDEALANARLIAAAPDLLEALKGMLNSEEDFLVSIDRAEAAIAKAEGRA